MPAAGAHRASWFGSLWLAQESLSWEGASQVGIAASQHHEEHSVQHSSLLVMCGLSIWWIGFVSDFFFFLLYVYVICVHVYMNAQMCTYVSVEARRQHEVSWSITFYLIF